jgi:DNA-binding LacI/PurR family transcriptional regulator
MSGGLIGLVLAGRAPLVGVEPFFMELVAGMEETLGPAGATVLLLVVPDLDAELATYRRWTRDRTVEAVVVVNLAHDDVRPGRLAELGLPAVLAGKFPGPPAFTGVVTDDETAMTTAMDLLAGLGHRVIGRVSGPASLVHTAERTAAMRAAAARLGVEALVAEADYSAASGVRGARELLAATPAPTAIVFDNDVMAVAAEEDLVRSGTRIPADVSLLAGDDSALCELAVPPLSALSVDVHEHGVTLGRAVLEVIAGGPARVHAGPAIRILHRASTAAAVTA